VLSLFTSHVYHACLTECNVEISIFIGYDGKPTRKHGLSWSESPSVLGYSFPYVIAVLPNNSVEIGPTYRLVENNQYVPVQTIALRAPQFLAVRGSDIYVASQALVWKLIPVPLFAQVEQLIKDKKYEEALTLCEIIPDSDEKVPTNVPYLLLLT
jgi:hypothetical protein